MDGLTDDRGGRLGGGETPKFPMVAQISGPSYCYSCRLIYTIYISTIQAG
jgi:hypothetical protein